MATMRTTTTAKTTTKIVLILLFTHPDMFNGLPYVNFYFIKKIPKFLGYLDIQLYIRLEKNSNILLDSSVVVAVYLSQMINTSLSDNFHCFAYVSCISRSTIKCPVCRPTVGAGFSKKLPHVDEK